MSFLKFIASSNFITVNKYLIKIYGLEEAVILGALASKFEYHSSNNSLDDEGGFFCTVQDLEEYTGLKRYKQDKAIKTLKGSKVLETKQKGIPAKRFFYINSDNIKTQLEEYQQTSKENSQFVGEQPHSSLESNEQDGLSQTSNNNTYNNNTDNNTTMDSEKSESLELSEFNKNKSFIDTPSKAKHNKRKKETSGKEKKKDDLYACMIDIYYRGYEWLYNVKPKIDGAVGKHTKELIKYLLSICENDPQKVQDTFKFITQNWKNLPEFNHDKYEMKFINSQISKIIAHFKTAKNEGYSKSVHDVIEYANQQRRERDQRRQFYDGEGGV